jgi:hypothetical protein
MAPPAVVPRVAPVVAILAADRAIAHHPVVFGIALTPLIRAFNAGRHSGG